MRKSGWTIDTVLDHLLALRGADSKAIEAALTAADKAVNTALASQEKATSVAEVTNLRWREAANEWRGAMDDRDRASAAALQRYAQRTEVDLMLSAVDQKVRDLQDAIKSLQTINAGHAGRSAGVNAAWGYLVGGVGIVAAVVAIALR